MDGEFLTIMGAGVVFIFGALGFLIWQKRQQADSAEPARAKKSAAAPAKPSKPAKANDDEKKSILDTIRAAVPIRAAEEEPDDGKPSEADLKKLEGLIAAQHIDEAARMAMRFQLWDKAAQLYLKADQPGNAAHCAKRAGKFEMAAEFYEKAGEVDTAVRMWERAGNTQRARELAGDKKGDSPDEEDAPIQISKELQAEIDAAIEKKDHMRAAELYEQGGDKEKAAEEFAAFAQTARRPEMYAAKIEALSKRVAYNLLRTAIKGRAPEASSADLYRRLASLQRHFGNKEAAIKTLRSLLRKVPDDDKATELMFEISGEPSPGPDDEDGLSVSDLAAGLDEELAAKAGTKKPDEAIEAAKNGPSIADLVGMIAGQNCDLGNIEVYYRLGLACLAAEKNEDAKRAFRAVDETSPGYRDTRKRLAALD